MNELQHPLTFYSIPHLALLAVSWSAAVFFAVFFSRKYGYTKKIVWGCLFAALLCEFEKINFFIKDTGDGFRLPAEQLPFNLCTLQIFFITILALSESPLKRKELISFMFPALIAGAFAGMVIPSATFKYHGLADLATYRYFFYHGMLIFLGLYLFLSKPIQFTIKSFGIASLGICLLVILGVWINAFFGWSPETNFCFFVRPPIEGLPILNMKNGWLAYVLSQGWIAVMLFFFCYLPVIIKETPGLIKSVFGNRGRRK